MSADPRADILRNGIRLMADRRDAAKAEQEAAQEQLKRLVQQAKDAGVSVQEIAGILGVSRQAVYDLYLYG